MQFSRTLGSISQLFHDPSLPTVDEGDALFQIADG
jgi:hypothetical protein